MTDDDHGHVLGLQGQNKVQNFFLFGLTVDEITNAGNGYDPQSIVESDDDLILSMNLVEHLWECRNEEGLTTEEFSGLGCCDRPGVFLGFRMGRQKLSDGGTVLSIDSGG